MSEETTLLDEDDDPDMLAPSSFSFIYSRKRYDGVWRAWIQKGATRVAFATGTSEAEAVKAVRAAYKQSKR